MRVGVLFGGSAVGSPAAVTDAVAERPEADGFFQFAQLAFGAADLQTVAVVRTPRLPSPHRKTVQPMGLNSAIEPSH
jgi:hypothetical protein